MSSTLLVISLALSPLGAEANQKQEEETYRQLETFANVLSILQEKLRRGDQGKRGDRRGNQRPSALA